MNKSTEVIHEDKELLKYLEPKFSWQLARIKLLVMLVTSLLKVQHIGFAKLSNSFRNNAKSDSSFRRIQRFFQKVSFDYDTIANLLFSLCPNKTSITIAIDRTNWQFGKLDINIFMLSICCDGISFPLLWSMLSKRGNSDTLERIELLQRFINLFGKDCIKALVADREFIGNKWFAYLQQEQIPYYIRVRENMWFTKPTKEKIKISWLLQGYKINELYKHPKLLYIDKVLVYVEAMKIEKGELLIIVSFKQHNAIEYYRNRWQIETLFKAFKTKGFNIEDTHLNDIDRINKLIAVVAIAYAWAYKVGQYVHENICAIKIKTHKRRAISLIKYGINFIASAIFKNNQQNLKIAFQVLSCT